MTGFFLLLIGLGFGFVIGLGVHRWEIAEETDADLNDVKVAFNKAADEAVALGNSSEEKEARDLAWIRSLHLVKDEPTERGQS